MVQDQQEMGFRWGFNPEEMIVLNAMGLNGPSIVWAIESVQDTEKFDIPPDQTPVAQVAQQTMVYAVVTDLAQPSQFFSNKELNTLLENIKEIVTAANETAPSYNSYREDLQQ